MNHNKNKASTILAVFKITIRQLVETSKQVGQLSKQMSRLKARVAMNLIHFCQAVDTFRISGNKSVTSL